jgi:excisionase family DNA binding protein
MKAMEETYLTMTEAAERMKVSYVTLYRAVESGKVRAIKTPGGRRRIPESEVARYWSEQNLHLGVSNGNVPD